MKIWSVSFVALSFVLVGLVVAESADTVTADTATADVAVPAESVVEGEIVKVVPSKREIYVLADGTKHEYYFNDATTVSKEGEARTFEDLQVGMKVKVVAKKIGKRLDPAQVEIVQ